jgi:uncharacterized protein (DUF697 family)
MNPQQTRALTSIALFAAFADGEKSGPERARVQSVVSAFGEPSLDQALREVLLKQTTLAAQAEQLDTPELRHLAWEAAVGVCEADGVTTDAEKTFLTELGRLLGRDAGATRQEITQADAIASRAAEAPDAMLTQTVERLVPPALPGMMPLAVAGGAVAGAAGMASVSSVSPGSIVDPQAQAAAQAAARSAESDKTILRYSILTAAIELLPQGLATVAIIPLQTKMVHSIAGQHGYPLSASMIKEFLATIGVGAAGQMVESYARKFLGKLAKQYLGKSAGSMVGTAVKWGTGPALTFATTYAIGQVAKQYYAGGRTISAINLQTLFSQQVDKAKGLYSQYEPQVMQTARGTSPSQIMGMLGGR